MFRALRWMVEDFLWVACSKISSPEQECLESQKQYAQKEHKSYLFVFAIASSCYQMHKIGPRENKQTFTTHKIVKHGKRSIKHAKFLPSKGPFQIPNSAWDWLGAINIYDEFWQHKEFFMLRKKKQINQHKKSRLRLSHVTCKIFLLSFFIALFFKKETKNCGWGLCSINIM